MVNLKQFQEEVHSITKFFEYKCDKRSIIKHMKKEIKEFKKAKPISPEMIYCAANIRDDKDFVDYFEMKLKGTEADEMPDPGFVMMSYAEEHKYDMEIINHIKKRYNSLRSKK